MCTFRPCVYISWCSHHPVAVFVHVRMMHISDPLQSEDSLTRELLLHTQEGLQPTPPYPLHCLSFSLLLLVCRWQCVEGGGSRCVSVW